LGVFGESVQTDLERLAAVASPRLNVAAKLIDLLCPRRFIFVYATWVDQKYVDVRLSITLTACH
jgi:hypothetical protein